MSQLIHLQKRQTLYQKVQLVLRVFRRLDKEIARVQKKTALQCASHCGKCCFKADIEASVLEFLPFAYELFKQRRHESLWFSLKNNPSPTCHLLSPFYLDSTGGFCSEYSYRGLICRLFGFSAMKDKAGNKKLVTCKIIKESAAYETAILSISTDTAVPVMSDYYSRLAAIDPDLGTKRYPINEAILKAIEVVIHYYSYRRPPKGIAI